MIAILAASYKQGKLWCKNNLNITEARELDGIYKTCDETYFISHDPEGYTMYGLELSGFIGLEGVDHRLVNQAITRTRNVGMKK